MSHPLLDAALLGLVEGVTEFIPVSSTGHLILTETFLQRPDISAKVFDIFIQIGAIMAVLFARRERVVHMGLGLFSDPAERRMALKIILAFLPAAFVGVLLHGFIKDVLFSPWVVAVSLIVGGVILLLVERIAPRPRMQNMDALSFKTALGVGLCQVAALIPGISRSGASIVGAQFLGVERRAATEFSFFLAIPTICGAAAYDLYKNWDIVNMSDLPVFAVGTLCAFVSALFIVSRLIDFVGKYGFAPFGYYRIIAGFSMLALLYNGVL